jgi:hypothetical protein
MDLQIQTNRNTRITPITPITPHTTIIPFPHKKPSPQTQILAYPKAKNTPTPLAIKTYKQHAPKAHASPNKQTHKSKKENFEELLKTSLIINILCIPAITLLMSILLIILLAK